MDRLISLFGLFVILGVTFAFSTQKRHINWKTVASGLFLQFFLAWLILGTGPGQALFKGARDFFTTVLAYTNQGSLFVFGPLADSERFGLIVFTMVLPTIIFTSSLMSILHHFGVIHVVTKAVGWVMAKAMGTSGAESLAAAANIFVGQTEAPLVVRPYLEKMTHSELMALMTGGMATVAGSVLAAYVGLGIDGGHLLAASVISAPASLVCAKMMVPERDTPLTEGTVKVQFQRSCVNTIDAVVEGANNGLRLAMIVGATLLSFVALIALVNGALGVMGGWFGFPDLSCEWILGYFFAPFAFLMGIPWEESMAVGILLGKKVILNEFVAYLDLQALIKVGALSERSVIITTYALCGFANFGSVAIQIGGIGAMVPSRRTELAKLGLKSLIGGTLACFMTASVAALLMASRF